MKFAHQWRTRSSPRWWFLFLAFGLLFMGQQVHGWQAEPPPPAPMPAVVPASESGKLMVELPIGPPIRIVPGQNADSLPERIARMQRTVQTDTSRLEELKRQMEDPNSDYAQAEAAFNSLDGQLADLKKGIQQAETEGDLALLEQRKSHLEELEKKWLVAKKGFQLALDERKARQASIPTLQTKIEKDLQALERLRGNDPAAVAPPAAAQPTSTHPLLPPSPPAAAPVASPQALMMGPVPATPPASAETLPTEANAAAGVAAIAPVVAEKPSAANKVKPDQRVVEAEKVAAKSVEVAQQAERNAASITERREILQKDIELERQLRTVSNGKAGAARDLLTDLNAQLETKLAAGAVVTELRQQIRQAEQALVAAQVETERISDHLDELQTELSTLQREQLAARVEAEQKNQEAEGAQRVVAALHSPFSLHNVLGWLANRGVTILIILVVLIVILWGGQLFEGRLVSLIALRHDRGNHEERENRAKTLVSVLHNAVRTLASTTAIVMVLDECGVPVGPILGGAAVIGLAVAFGAQSLIKDYFTGFMVLMEQQYMIGDVIKIGETTAQVERISLRMTVLRDLEGRVHFIPHGQITTVTNLTHEWSRAVFDIGVAYKEDTDRVIGVLMELAQGMRKDPRFAYMIVEDPVMLGVDALGESAVVVKFIVKTRPFKQWDIKRELLRRIKRRFDELSIEIPFPHRTLYLGDAPAASALRMLAQRDSLSSPN